MSALIKQFQNMMGKDISIFLTHGTRMYGVLMAVEDWGVTLLRADKQETHVLYQDMATFYVNSPQGDDRAYANYNR